MVVRGPAAQVQIVGVIEDIRQQQVAREAYSEIFMDYRQIIAIQQRSRRFHGWR